MINLDLKNIILDGDLSPIEMGQSEDQVIQILGEPDENRSMGSGITIITYSGYQFHFFDNKLICFMNDYLKADSTSHAEDISFKNQFFKIDTWFLTPNKNTSMKDVISLFKEEDISFDIESEKVGGQNYKEGKTKNIILPNGVELVFEKDDQQVDFILYAITYSSY